MAFKVFRTPAGVLFLIPEAQFLADTQAYAEALQCNDAAVIAKLESGATGWQETGWQQKGGAAPLIPHGAWALSAEGVQCSELPESTPKQGVMRLVIVESPFAGDVEKNTHYARLCVRDSLLRGEAPIASHLLYTQPGILNDDIPAERQHGIDAGLAWRAVAQASVVYTDLGISKGMEYGIQAAKGAGVPIEYRTLPDFENGALHERA